MSADKEERVREDERRGVVRGQQLSRVRRDGEDVGEAMMRANRHIVVSLSVIDLP